MKPFRSSFRSILSINLHLMTSGGCAAIAWMVWPAKPEWWGLGLLSIILAISAVVGLCKALTEAAALYRRQKVITDYLAQGGKPKAARLATLDDLERAGMLDE